MKKVILISLAAMILLIIGCVVTFSIMSKISEEQLSDTIISEVNLDDVSDGTYVGSHRIFPVYAEVEVTVKNHKITDIKIIKHNNGKGSQAEILPGIVLEKQSLDVDVISSATTSSKAILKAIENALRGI